MINHIRTLLANQDGRQHAQGSFQTPGEALIDPSFRKRMLPQLPQLLHRVIFGSSPDRLFLNYRLWQLMELVHSTDFHEYVRELDDRITYWPLNTAGGFFSDVFVVTPQSLQGDGEIFLSGKHTADERLGRCSQKWQVSINSGSTTVIPLNYGDNDPVVAAYTDTNGLSSAVDLTGSQLKARFRGHTSGDRWLITSNARPHTDIAIVLATAAQAVEGHENEVFPNRQLATAYTQAKSMPEKYAALLVGLALTIAAAPQEQP